MKQQKQAQKWSTVKILTSTKEEIQNFCSQENTHFPNSSQFINFAIRKELDRREDNET